MSGTILVGVDSSTPSRSALAWSVSRAAAAGAMLELVHVVDREWTERGSVEWNDVREKAGVFLHGELLHAQGLYASVPITASLAEGRPPAVLAKRSKGYDLLVVGTHKTGFIYGRAFGSRFLGLGWRAGCDVAFIPDLVGYDRRGVVAGVEDSPTGDAIIRFAAAEAAHSSQELTLVSSWGSATRVPRDEGAVARRAGMMSRAVRLAKDSEPHLRVRSRVAKNLTAEALIEASAGAALLVIGRPRRQWASSAFRAVNHDVLVNMSSPVIVVLEEDEMARPRRASAAGEW